MERGPASVQDRLVPPSVEAMQRSIRNGECPFCGRSLKNIAGHTYRTHGINARELKDMAALPKTHTASPHMTAEWSEARKQALKGNPEAIAPLLTSSHRSSKRKYSKAGREIQIAKIRKTHTRENWEKVAKFNSARLLAATAELDAEIVRRITAGQSAKEVKAAFGVSNMKIRAVLNRAGVTTDLRTIAHKHRDVDALVRQAQIGSARKVAQVREERLKRWEELGQSWEAIDQLAQEWGLSPRHVRHYIRHAGGQVPDGRANSDKRFWERPPRPERKCEIEGCDSRHSSRGMCSKHRQRWSNGPRKDGVSAQEYIESQAGAI